MMKSHQYLTLCGLICGLKAKSSAAFDVDALDAAILKDMLESYNEHTPSTCTAAAGSTTFSFEYPGVNPDSEWYAPFEPFEEDLFLAVMSHADENDRSWTIRIGQGGNMYSHYCPDLHGETMPPQAHTNAPWIDEVHQSVSVNGYLNFGAGRCNGETCPANFVHGAGTYQRDAPYTNEPFFSQSLAKHCSENSCTFAAWGQQAHLATIFTSSVMTFNKFTNCGNGVIEHTQMIHNFAPENAVDPSLVDQTYFNTPWSGVRTSKLPYALEPNYITGILSYEDPDAVDYCPLCNWGNDAKNGPQDLGDGRCARDDLRNLGGYTTFAAPGLFVNRETSHQQYLWCRKPNADCYANPSTCMARPSECYQEDGSAKTGYTPIQLQVPAGSSSPQCQNHIGVFEGYQTLQCKFHAKGFGNCGTYLYAGTSSDPCAPWLEGGRMSIIREDTNEGINIPYVRHWSWSPNDKYMYFSVDSQNQAEAIALVNTVFDNSGNTTHPLHLRFETLPPGDTFPGPDYDPGRLASVTFVYGDGNSYNAGRGRRRIGSSNRDYTVFTVNWWHNGAKLTPGDTFSKRSFLFASDLASAQSTADALIPNVVPDKISDTRWNPRSVDLYKLGSAFDVVAATSSRGATTTCSSTSATLECSGYSTPKAGYVPFFYITCQDSIYIGPDPYHFTPGNGDWFTFPGMSDDNSQKIRSYACEGEVQSVRPTWKLMGWFEASSCSLGSGINFDDSICEVTSTSTEEPSSSPSNLPSQAPSDLPSNLPSQAPSDLPSNPPSQSPSDLPSSLPSQHPSSSLSPSNLPSQAPSDLPSNLPSQHPSNLSSDLPSQAPSDLPNEPPSQNPSKSFQPSAKQPSPSSPQFSFSMESEMTVQTGGDVSTILADPVSEAIFVESFETTTSELYCPSDSTVNNCESNVLTLNGESVDSRRKLILRRSLQATNTLVVEFQTSIQVICGTSTCSDAETLGTALYNEATGALKEAMQDGSFISDLQAELSQSQITGIEDVLDGASATVSFAELIIPILQRYPSASPSSTPSCTPSASPTGSPSTEYGVKMFYPDWVTGAQGCRNDGDEPGYMAANPTDWLSSTLEACCKKWFSGFIYNTCIGKYPQDSDNCVTRYYYPDWQGSNKGCLADGQEPLYMLNNNQYFLSESKKECCEKFYPWNLYDCTGTSPVLTNGDYYPDWADSSSQTCLNDGNVPDYMLANQNYYLFTTLEKCCNKHFSWNINKCLGTASSTTVSGTNKWYVDWTDSKCVKDCVGNSPCGGIAESWEELHNSHEECCEEKLSWLSKRACLTK